MRLVEVTEETRSPRRRLRSDGGSLIVELAIVLPFLILLVSGIFEFGLAYREKSNLSGALRSAARIDTTNGAARSADYLALQSFNLQMAQAKNITVNKVVIYKTTSLAGAPLDPTCFTSATPSAAYLCNVYTGGQIASLGADPLTHFGTAVACVGSWDLNYCPITRNDQQGDPPDYVGVWASVTYASSTGLLPSTVVLTDKSVFRIDPKVTS
jgi:Flp pilus assembly protein TadG